MILGSSLPAFAASRADARNDTELRKFLQQTISQTSSFKDRFDAEVWLVSMSSKMQAFKNLENADRIRILKSVHQEATLARLTSMKFLLSRTRTRTGSPPLSFVAASMM